MPVRREYVTDERRYGRSKRPFVYFFLNLKKFYFKNYWNFEVNLCSKANDLGASRRKLLDGGVSVVTRRPLPLSGPDIFGVREHDSCLSRLWHAQLRPVC